VVALRRWEIRDLPCVEEAARDLRIPEGTTVPAQFTDEAGRAWIERQWSRAEVGEGVSLAVTAAGEGRALGAAVLLLRPQPRVAGVGYWLVESARGHGLACRAVRLITDWGLREQRLARVEAWVTPGNAASQRVLIGAGFRHEGRLRSFLELGGVRQDALVFSRIPADSADG
jgi:RimJ/RimL family protein N-acetyltransferase